MPRLYSAMLVLALSLLQIAPVTANQQNGISIAGINTTPRGQTYGRWAAEWWQWAIAGTPATNPLVDPDGRNCQRRQVGETFFLAGSPSNDPVVRRCTVPAGKALFFPLITLFSGAELNDPPEERTPAFVRSQAICQRPDQLLLEIDGVKVRQDLYQFFTGESGSLSPLFNIQLNPDNIFGATRRDTPELAASPAAEQGYYVYLWPLSQGEHTIHWRAVGCYAPDGVQDVTYELKIR